MQPLGFNEALWLMATGRATREALLSEASFEKVSGPRSVGASCFVDDFVFNLLRVQFWTPVHRKRV